jgi:hypothetical protein
MIYIKQPKLIESSGICRSVTTPGLYYSHNDSGSLPVLYGFNEMGEALGEFPLKCKAIDCEAVSSAMVNGVPTIILADVGDNNCARPSYRINVVIEGSPTPHAVKSINFAYPDGKRRNCEAVVLLPNGIIYLITKSYPKISGLTQVFQLMSWLSGDSGTICFPGPVLNAKMGIITDANYKDGQIVLLGNGKAHIFNSGDWVNFRSVPMPVSTQPEGVCFSHDGKKLLMTSETNKTAGVLTPLYSVPIA